VISRREKVKPTERQSRISHTFSIVVPILNEREIIQSTLDYLWLISAELSAATKDNWEFVIVDAGSADGTGEILRSVQAPPNWILVQGNIEKPSVGKTVSLGISKASGSILLILPCDCRLGIEALLEVDDLARRKNVICGGFPKTYEPSSSLLKTYQAVQNVVRLRMFRHVVWTNGIFFSRSLINKKVFPVLGFLEDILLSDQLRNHQNWSLLKSRIWVSSRRYFKRSQLKRMSLNILILITYRLKFMSEIQLRAIYYK